MSRAACRRTCTSGTCRHTPSCTRCSSAKAGSATSRTVRAVHASGWWGVGPAAEAFLDQLVTWRELGFNMCATRPQDYDQYASLPAWARTTLALHGDDKREHVYTARGIRGRSHARSALERGAGTARPGGPHPQLPADAVGQEDSRVVRLGRGGARGDDRVEQQVRSRRPGPELLQRHFLDARPVRSRPWFERPVFGTVRYMSSANTARKMRVKAYIAQLRARVDRRGTTLVVVRLPLAGTGCPGIDRGEPPGSAAPFLAALTLPAHKRRRRPYISAAPHWSAC